jgi:hypothetical protein
MFTHCYRGQNIFALLLNEIFKIVSFAWIFSQPHDEILHEDQHYWQGDQSPKSNLGFSQIQKAHEIAGDGPTAK